MKLTVFIAIVFTAWLTGCSLMLQDVASSRIAKLESSACPDLSGRYGQGEARLESAYFPTKTEKDSVLHLIVLIPTDQEKVVDDIYEHFFDGGFKFEVQQFMVFLCTAFPHRRIPHAGFYNPAPFWGDD